jgi:uncharacterized protein (DUF2267 family)
MTGEYQVAGGYGYAVPGAIGPDEVDGRADWVRLEGRGLADQLHARLGSEVDLRKVLLGVLSPLLGALRGEPVRAIAARLPYGLARELLDGDDGATNAPAGAEQYLREVSELLQHPLSAAAFYVRAVLGSVRATLPPEMDAEVERRLLQEIAELWRTSR